MQAIRTIERNIPQEQSRHAQASTRLRVLLISHTCQSRMEGQPKAERLGQMPDVDLRVLVPNRWKEYSKWRLADLPEHASFTGEVGKVIWPWSGPAQWYLHWYPGLPKLLREFQPDIIDIWEEPWGLVSAQTCWLRNRLVPHAKIITETEQNINKRLPFPFEQIRSYTLKQADFAIGRNAEAIEVLQAKNYQGPAQVVPNAVDIDLFRPLDRAECRRKLGLSGFVAGYIGRLVEEKGLLDLLACLPQCPDNVHLLFVGSGALQEELETRVAEMGMTHRVRFLANRPMQELPQIMNALDVLVLPSRTTASWKEQFGRVIIEANACQIPVIGTNSGAIPEVVGKAGLIVPEQDPAALARAIAQMQTEQLHKMGQIGREQVERSYSWEQVASAMHEIYWRVLRGSPTVQPSCVLENT